MMKIGENLDINLENYHSIIYSQKRATAQELKTADQNLKDGIRDYLVFIIYINKNKLHDLNILKQIE